MFSCSVAQLCLTNPLWPHEWQLGFPVLLYLQAMYLVTQLCLTLWNPVDCSPPGSSVHGDSPGKNTRVGCHDLLQGIIPTQGSNLHTSYICLHWQVNSLPLLSPGKPILHMVVHICKWYFLSSSHPPFLCYIHKHIILHLYIVTFQCMSS